MSFTTRSFFVAATACLLSACSVPTSTDNHQPIATSSADSSSKPQGMCTTEAAMQEGIDLYQTTAPLSTMGAEALHQLLVQNTLVPLEELQELGGKNALSPDLCRWIFAAYNTHADETASDERCSQNIRPDGKTFEEYGIPISIRAWELEKKYVALFIAEEGLGAPLLFSSLYDLDAKTIHTIDASVINTLPTPINHITYSKDAIHYFWKSDSGAGSEECAGMEVATFDLKTGTLTVQK